MKNLEYNTDFQKALVKKYGLKWWEACATDWVSIGASNKEVAVMLEVDEGAAKEYLRKAYAIFGLKGPRSRLMLVGVRQYVLGLTVAPSAIDAPSTDGGTNGEYPEVPTKGYE